MPSRYVLALFEALIPLCAGAWATLVGIEFIGKPADADLNPRYQIRRRVYRTCGPVMIALGLWIAVQPLVAPLIDVSWQTYTAPGFSIELPGTPEESVVDETGEYGPVKNHQALVVLKRLATTCVVRYTPLPERFPELTVSRSGELLKSLVKSAAADGELIDEEETTYPAGLGRRFRVRLKEGYVYEGEFLFQGRTQLLLMLIVPSDLAGSALSRRFFHSLTFPVEHP